MAIIDKIQLSGTVYTIGNETTTAVTSASTDNEIPTAKAVYDAIPQGGSGGGKAISAGTNISITTGETADTINCTLPISGGTGTNALIYNSTINVASGDYSHSEGYISKAEGYASHAEGLSTKSKGFGSHAEGYFTITTNESEHSSGKYNNSVSSSTTFGDSGNTLFSVGNGTSNDKRHNAIDIRQNGDIYIADTNDTSTTNYYEKPMIKLQDALGGGGGGSSYTAGDGIDITNDVISVTGKVDTSTYETYTAATDTALSSKQTTLTAGTGISIVDNVISATGGGSGGGKAVSAGTNISVTTGETADTINCTLPIKTNAWRSLTFNSSQNPSKVLYASAFGDYTTASGEASFSIGKNTTASGNYSFVGGQNNSKAIGETSFAFGEEVIAKKKASAAFGRYITTNNFYEFACGVLNNSLSGSSTFGDSGNTLFSVGNGESSSERHNAFEIRQNGDIYITKDGQDVKLQDQLGGGGSSYTAGDGIDITNDVISVTGKVDTSAITTSITSESTDAQVPSAKAVYDQLGGLKLVKLTQSEYSAMEQAGTLDNSTLYIVISS